MIVVVWFVVLNGDVDGDGDDGWMAGWVTGAFKVGSGSKRKRDLNCKE
jgi:hypothetical protein